jgi:hypothetical protein
LPGFVTLMLENVRSEPGLIEDDAAAARRIAMSPERLIDAVPPGCLRQAGSHLPVLYQSDVRTARHFACGPPHESERGPLQGEKKR